MEAIILVKSNVIAFRHHDRHGMVASNTSVPQILLVIRGSLLIFLVPLEGCREPTAFIFVEKGDSSFREVVIRLKLHARDTIMQVIAIVVDQHSACIA